MKELFKEIRHLNTNKRLSSIGYKKSEDVRDKFQRNGITLNGQLNYETRDIINILPPFDVGSKTDFSVNHLNEDVAKILSKVIYLPDNVKNVKVPFISPDSAQWCNETGYLPDQNHQITSAQLKGHRLSTRVIISNELINKDNDILEQKITEAIINSIYEKLVATMFSDEAQTTSNPKGLFNGVEVVNITSIDDLLNMQYEMDKLSSDNTFLVSAGAKKAINELSANYPLIKDDKLLNSECICTNLVKDGFICYMPLRYLAVADWNAISFSINPITKAVDNETEIFVDCYFDYDLTKAGLIKVGRFANE